MPLLTLETTCDETAAAVIDRELRVLGSAVASQHEVHERFGGVVPELASRAHVERILPVIDEALRQARLTLAEIEAVGVTVTPGLAGSLLVGLSAAKCLAWARGVPLVALNHVHAHIYACRMKGGPGAFPCVGLVVSGGHTNLYRCDSPIEFELLGSTIDDAAGEAFDKVASLLGLPYPGGPAIERAAAGGNPRAHDFPRALVHEPNRLEFSFSGLKTAVRYKLFGPGKLPDPLPRLAGPALADVAASFQAAVVDVLAAKSLDALRATGLPTLCVGGGVAANRTLGARLEADVARLGRRLIVAPRELCTDNAVMGALAWELLAAGHTSPLDVDIAPGLERR